MYINVYYNINLSEKKNLYVKITIGYICIYNIPKSS